MVANRINKESLSRAKQAPTCYSEKTKARTSMLCLTGAPTLMFRWVKDVCGASISVQHVFSS